MTTKTSKADLKPDLRPDRRYEYMPASLDSFIKGYTVGVKYKPKVDDVSKLDRVKNGFRIERPDRVLYFMRSFIPSADRLLDVDFDQVLDLDFCANRSLVGRHGYNYAMVNSSAMSEKYSYPDYAAERQPDWPLYVADSGGFQLHSGTEEFLDPVAIVKKHSSVCDIGIALDIPIPHMLQDTFITRAAAVQRKNNEVFRKHAVGSLDVMNVLHGNTFYLKDRFRETVEDNSFTRLAVGGMKTLDLVPLVLQLIYAIKGGKAYDQYHALGVSGLERWLALSYLGHKKIAKLITSDSSSYIQSGKGLRFYDPHRLMGTVDLRDSIGKVNDYARLPCNCEICTIQKYVSTFTDRKFTLGFASNTGHNLLVTRNYVDEIYELAGYPKKEIFSWLRRFTSPARLKVIALALNAVDMAVEESPQKSAARYAPYLLQKTAASTKQGLFGSMSQAEEGKRRTHFETVISRYEKYHGLTTKKAKT